VKADIACCAADGLVLAPLSARCNSEGESANLAQALATGYAVTALREETEEQLGEHPRQAHARLHDAFCRLAVGEIVTKHSGAVSQVDLRKLEQCAQHINAQGAVLAVASLHLMVRPELCVFESFRKLNTTRLADADAAADKHAKLSALRAEPATPSHFFDAMAVEQLVGQHTNDPCIYFAWEKDVGTKIGDASLGVNTRYNAQARKTMTAIPILLTLPSLRGGQGEDVGNCR
jgi:hypothetical protein